MINKENKKSPLKRLVSVLILSAIATACSTGNGSSNSNNSNNENGDVRSLQLVAPKTIYSLPSGIGTGYMVVKNPTNQAVKNLHYSLTNQVGSGQQVEIDSVSAAACAEVTAYSQCNVKVIVPAGAIAGSVEYVVDNNGTNLLNRLGKILKVDTANNIVASGIEQAAYNKLSGADGITLSYYHTVINGTPYILVSGLVASASAGTFNKIVLVNGSGTVLPNQELISPVSNAQGSTFNILLPIPSGNNISQTIKVQTQQVSGGETTVVSTATSSSTLTTTQNVGIAEMLPSAVYLTTANPEQIITFANTGDAIAQLQQLVSNNPNVEVVFNPSSLSSGATSTATLKLKDKAVSATTGDVILTYNNGQIETSTSGTVDQNVNPTPSPTPSPSPTPTPSPTPGPAPAPTPYAGLTAAFNPDNDFFTTTAIGTVSRQLTLTNSGNTDEDAIVLTLPTNFTISAGSDSGTTCTVTQGTSPATLNNILTAGDSCTVTVTYNNSSITSLRTENISIVYDYNGGTPAPTSTTAAVNYKVVPPTAVLSLSPSTAQNYGSIPSDNTAISNPITYTLTNSGEVTATSLNFIFDGTNASLFSVISGGTCIANGSLPSTPGSNTCTIDTRFGPALNGSAGSKSANFRVDYIPYPSGTIQATSVVNVSGTVTAAPSATFTSAVTANTFTGGSGTSGTPYTGYTNTAYTMDVTYTNTSSIPASGFTTAYTTPPTGWTMSTHGCNNVPMATNGTCTDVYTLNSASTGTTSINLGNVTASWSDSSGTYNNQAIQGSTIYASLSVLPPAITITPVDNWQTVMGSAYAFIATITGGSSTVTPAVTGITGSTISPVSCDLDSSALATSSCTFIISPYTGAGNYSFWDPASIANSTNVNTPSNAYPSTTGISLQVTADNGATINNGATQPFSITGTVIAPYVYLAAPEEGASSATNTGITWGSGGTVSTRFTDGSQNGGSTCTDSLKDNLTGLEWAKNADLFGLKAWRLGGNPYTYPAQEAIDDMNGSNPSAPGYHLCGYTDWRLPTITELLSLINYAETSQATWLISQNFTDVQTATYWSSTLGGSGAWYLNFSVGNVGSNALTGTGYVWPVRGVQ